jgi:hypothetical protein
VVSHRALVVLAAGLIAVLVAGSAYAFSERGSEGATQSRVNLHGDTETQEELSGGPSAPDKAALIADAFGVSPDAVLAHHNQGFGWGALFKLYAFARAKGVSVDQLIAAAPTDGAGKKEFAFGDMKQSLTAEQVVIFEEGPKNFGQLMSSSRRNSHARTP